MNDTRIRLHAGSTRQFASPETAMSASSAVIIVRPYQRKKLTRYLVRSGAIDSETAVSPSSLPRTDSQPLDKLREQGIVLSTAEGYFYLDRGRLGEVSAAEIAETRKMMLVAISIFAVGMALFTGLAYLLAAA